MGSEATDRGQNAKHRHCHRMGGQFISWWAHSAAYGGVRCAPDAWIKDLKTIPNAPSSLCVVKEFLRVGRNVAFP